MDSSPLPGSQELPEEKEAETDFSSRLPAAHLIGNCCPQLESLCSFIAGLGFRPASPPLVPKVPTFRSSRIPSSCFPPGAVKTPPGSLPPPPPRSAPHTRVPLVPSPKSLQRWRRTPSPRSPARFLQGVKSPLSPSCSPSQKSRAWGLPPGSGSRAPTGPRFSTGAWTKGQGLGWEAKKEEAFLRSGTQFSGAEGLALPQDGLYYLYCHVGYRGRAPPAGGGPLDPSVTLRSRLYRAGGAYGPGTPELLLEGAETVTPVSDPARTREYGPLWYTSVGFGGLVQLRRGERVYVNISHPDMVDYRRGKTFFGAVMVG